MSTSATILAGGQSAGGVSPILFSDLLPSEPPALGPYVLARCPGRCVDCGQVYTLDEWIRGDGHGGWLAECCGGDA